MEMQTIPNLALLTSDRLMVALLGAPEIIGVLAVILILYAAGRLPHLLDGIRGGWSEFLKGFNQASHDAGKSLGGIFGKPAAQALTPDNQTAELYDPAALRRKERSKRVSSGAFYFAVGKEWCVVGERCGRDSL